MISLGTKILENIWEENILPVMRSAFFHERVFKAPGSKFVFNLWENFFKLAGFQFVTDYLPEFDPKKTEMSWIPINKTIEGMDEIALPEKVLDTLIEKAKHRVIVSLCGCRAASSCENYSSDIGCLMMGESALLIPKQMSREVGVDEAKAHVRKAVEAGLIPITGKARIDNDIFMIPDKGKLLTVCFCCECCCITRFMKHVPIEKLDELVRPVEGLTITVTDDCIGCGKCVDKCFINAIEIVDEKAVLSELCRSCGRCALYCPTKAIKLSISESDAADQVVARIEAVVDF
ncbi:4Fe-4S ferredoxin [Candidatus Magnetomorum sp. HK-1]|nr:4Fe-4S ferredoxin [Candidatus Magnetomorum sp. HK-1]